MAYTVTIAYSPLVVPEAQNVAPISRIYTPDNSYIDADVYGGTVYDTNVDGQGEIVVPEPFASTSVPFPVPLAQFKMAYVGLETEVEGVITHTVKFTVEDYKEAFYYKEIGISMADQGFTVTVEEKTAA